MRSETIASQMKPLNLTDEEVQVVVAFLGALTDRVEMEAPTLPK